MSIERHFPAADVEPGMYWGLLGPAVMGSERRTRTLGLGAVVRRFNELAVPGIGGIWFIRQALLATLGIYVAQQARQKGVRVSNIECANSVEALACMLALRERDWEPDPRLRGSSKLPRVHALDFRSVRRPGFYVSQPMRMATAQALPPLGLVQTGGSRFNGFEVTAIGEEWLQVAFKGLNPYNRSVVEHLVLWLQGEGGRMDTGPMVSALSPCASLSLEARRLMRDRLLRGSPSEDQRNRQRRTNALAWVGRLQEGSQLDPIEWPLRPAEIDMDHWADLRAGAALFATRDLAIQALDALERQLAAAPGERLNLNSPWSTDVCKALEALKKQADDFLALEHCDEEAVRFARICSAANPSQVLRQLLDRDGRVLRLVGQEIRPGMAFRRGEVPQAVATSRGGDSDAEGGGEDLAADVNWPDYLSFRVPNLYLLALDLSGKLDGHLKSLGSSEAGV